MKIVIHGTYLHIFANQQCVSMEQYNASNHHLRKRYQISFRRWITAKSGGGTVNPYVGSDFLSVRKNIENAMFPDMTWSNYGELWVIDHVVPLRLFDMTKKEELKICLHYKNLMPLYKEDNLYKEGAVDFSMRMLDRLPPCEIVLKLKERLLLEINRMDKYLTQ